MARALARRPRRIVVLDLAARNTWRMGVRSGGLFVTLLAIGACGKTSTLDGADAAVSDGDGSVSADATADGPADGSTDASSEGPELLLRQFQVSRLVLGPKGLVTRTVAVDAWPGWPLGDGAAGIFEIPYDTHEPRLVVESGFGYGYSLTTAGDSIYVCDSHTWEPDANALWTVPLSGGTPTPLVIGPDGWDLVANDTHVYFTSRSKGQVLRVPLAGGAPEVFAEAPEPYGGIALDATHVYWFTAGTLKRAPLSGGPAVDLVSGEVVYSGVPQPLQTDDAFVYWLAHEPCNLPACSLVVRRIAKTGGTVETSGAGKKCWSFAIDEQFVYCPENNSIVRAPKDGSGPPAVVISGVTWQGSACTFAEWPPGVHLIVVNATDIYFTLSGCTSGQQLAADEIFRMPKPKL